MTRVTINGYLPVSAASAIFTVAAVTPGSGRDCKKNAVKEQKDCTKKLPIHRGKWKCDKDCKKHLSNCVKKFGEAMQLCGRRGDKNKAKTKTTGNKTEGMNRPYWWDHKPAVDKPKVKTSPEKAPPKSPESKKEKPPASGDSERTK